MAAAVSLLPIAGPLMAASHYTINKVDLPGGTSTTISGINDSGEIVGYSRIAPQQVVGFFSQKGTLTQFQAGFPEENYTYPQAINNDGMIVGLFGGEDGSPYNCSYFCRDFIGKPNDGGIAPGGFIYEVSISQDSHVGGDFRFFNDNTRGIPHGFVGTLHGGSPITFDIKPTGNAIGYAAAGMGDDTAVVGVNQSN